MFLGGGVAGAEPLHKGGPKARPPINQKKGAGDRFARLIQHRELIVAETLRIFWASEIGRYDSTQYFGMHRCTK